MKEYKYKNLTSLEAEKKCKELFIENYIKDKNNNRIIIKTLNNEKVIFEEKAFSHAFSYRNKILNIEDFSYQRARRVLWIKEILIGNNSSAIRKDIGKDVFYYDKSENYLIYLKKLKSGNLLFITHYVVKSDKKLKWIKKKII